MLNETIFVYDFYIWENSQGRLHFRIAGDLWIIVRKIAHSDKNMDTWFTEKVNVSEKFSKYYDNF